MSDEHKTVDRAALIAEAKRRGYSEEQLLRQTNHSIQTMLAQKQHRHRKIAPSLDQYVKMTTQALKPRDLDEVDDTKTVIDMSHVTTTSNPIDKNYKRFQMLSQYKNELISAIQINSTLFQEHQKQLDEDDAAIMQQEIAHIQKQLSEVTAEMRELHQWFIDTNLLKQSFYEQFLKNSKDVSGALSSHFQKKLDNIHQYMKSIQECNDAAPQTN